LNGEVKPRPEQSFQKSVNWEILTSRRRNYGGKAQGMLKGAKWPKPRICEGRFGGQKVSRGSGLLNKWVSRKPLTISAVKTTGKKAQRAGERLLTKRCEKLVGLNGLRGIGSFG